MITRVLVGLVSGLLAGVSPCILPVLPVIFMSSTAVKGAATAASPQGRSVGTIVKPRRDLTPFLVVGGLALSFSVFTLLGTLLLDALPIPDDTIRVAGLVLLVLFGVGMLVPGVERVLEKPFARLRIGNGGGDRRGFGLGLVLGAVYVPCAGPVLAAVTVAGATGDIGADTVALTVSFAIGTAIPLLVFALAGQRVSERVRAFRDHQRRWRAIGGVVVIALAVALTFNVTDVIQRAVPDYTAKAEAAVVESPVVQDVVGNKQSQSLRSCANSRSTGLLDCGAAPPIKGIDAWFNTADDQPVTAADLQGKVYLIDFWAYSCINCQRAIPHVEAWYQKYKDAGFEVIGVHTPEYAFEHDLPNVESGAQRLGMTYPVALDNDYGTWNSFGNNSWPAEYLVDATGQVRHVAIGEGDYDVTENLIRKLLAAADPGASLGEPTQLADTTPTDVQTPETYLGSARAQYYAGDDLPLGNGPQNYPTFPKKKYQNSFVLGGHWTVSPEEITAGKDARIREIFAASKVYLNVGGTGTLTVHLRNHATKVFHVRGAPNIYPVVDLPRAINDIAYIELTPGLKAYSFTFG